MKKFEIGEKYNGYTVVSRTEKSVKLQDELGCVKTRKIEVKDEVETCKCGKHEYITANNMGQKNLFELNEEPVKEEEQVEEERENGMWVIVNRNGERLFQYGGSEYDVPAMKMLARAKETYPDAGLKLRWIETEVEETEVESETVEETNTVKLVEDEKNITVETKKVTVRRRTVNEDELINYLPKRDQAKVERIEKADKEASFRYLLILKENYGVNDLNEIECLNWKEVVEVAKMASELKAED